MEKTKFERTLKRAEIYQELINSYRSGISLESITDMIDLDYNRYMRKLKYSFTGIKQSYNYNNPTVIEDEYDLIDVNAAYDFLKNKIDYIDNHNEDRDNFFDIVIKQKETIKEDCKNIPIDSVISMIEYDIDLFDKNKILDRFIETESDESLDAFSKQEENTTAIKTEKEKEIKKLALELIKKENN